MEERCPRCEKRPAGKDSCYVQLFHRVDIGDGRMETAKFVIPGGQYFCEQCGSKMGNRLALAKYMKKFISKLIKQIEQEES